MPPYTCPNCGFTESTALAAPAPGACPRCCASLKPTTEIAWQRWPTLPFPQERPRIRLALAPNEEAPALARRAISGLRGDLDESEIFIAQLLVTELVSNVVMHASDMSPRRARTTVWLSSARLRVDVLDAGQGFRPRLASPDLESESGWGLKLVDTLADEWGVVPGEGSWVWFEMLRQRAPATVELSLATEPEAEVDKRSIVVPATASAQPSMP